MCRLALETNLKIEREWRINLQEELHKEKEKIGALQQTLNQYENLKKVSTTHSNALQVYLFCQMWSWVTWLSGQRQGIFLARTPPIQMGIKVHCITSE